MFRRLILFISISSIVLSLGCGGGRAKPKDMPDLYPCNVTITQDGAPLVGATVVLASTISDFKWSGIGTTNEKGVAEIYTNGFYKGVPLGTFKVSVSKTEREGPELPDEDTLPEDPNERKKIIDPIKKQIAYYDIVAAEYMDGKTTPLEIEITSGKNDQTFDVGAKVKVQVRDE